MAADQEGSVEAGEQSGLSCRTLRETRNPERGVGRKDRAAVRRRDLTPEAAEPSSPGYGQGVSIRLRLTQAEAVYENEKDTHCLLPQCPPGSPGARWSPPESPASPWILPDLGLLP